MLWTSQIPDTLFSARHSILPSASHGATSGAGMPRTASKSDMAYKAGQSPVGRFLLSSHVLPEPMILLGDTGPPNVELKKMP
jgi:hypothetical protein